MPFWDDSPHEQWFQVSVATWGRRIIGDIQTASTISQFLAQVLADTGTCLNFWSVHFQPKMSPPDASLGGHAQLRPCNVHSTRMYHNWMRPRLLARFSDLVVNICKHDVIRWDMLRAGTSRIFFSRLYFQLLPESPKCHQPSHGSSQKGWTTHISNHQQKQLG